MELYTKEQIMALKPQELLEYTNHILSVGVSLNDLERKTNMQRKTIRERLKRIGYVYDGKSNRYVLNKEGDNVYFINPKPVKKAPKEEKKTPKAKEDNLPKITLEELQKRVEALEMRFSGIEKAPTKAGDIEIIKFNSKTHDRNYPFHQEVVDLLEEIKLVNNHLKVKDIVNTALYLGLSKLKDSSSIG